MILHFVLYSPLRNLLSQIINYFRPKSTRPKTIRPKPIYELAYPHSNRSHPVHSRASGIKSSRACCNCPVCGHYGRHCIHAHEVVLALPEPHHDLLSILILTLFPFPLRIANPAPIGKLFYVLLPGNM